MTTTPSPTSPLATLLAQHLPLVYAAALRQTHNSHLAEDITQSVFLLAAKKHNAIPPNHTAAWLLKVTHYLALTTLRADRRRRLHEYRAASEAPTMTVPEPTPHPTLDAHLDAALASLSPPDRELLLRRYFQNHPVADIAAALSLSPNTTTKRLTRALEKLRDGLHRAGLSEASLASLPATLFSVPHPAAPTALAGKILAASTTPTLTSIPLGILCMSTATKITLSVAALLLFLLLAVLVLDVPTKLQQTPRQTLAAIPAAAPASSPSTQGHFHAFPTNATSPAQAQLLAITTDRRTWWYPDGSSFPGTLAGANFSTLHDPYNEQRTVMQFAFHLADLPPRAGTLYLYTYGNPRPLFTIPLQPDPHDTSLFYGAALLYPEQKTTHLLVCFSTVPWETIAIDPSRKLLTPPTHLSKLLFQMLPIVPNSIEDIQGTAVIHLGLEPFGDYEYQVNAIAKDGTLHRAADTFTGSIFNYEPIWSFDIPLRDVQRFQITIRPLNENVRFEQLSLRRGQITEPYSALENPPTPWDSRFFNIQYEIGQELQRNNLPAAAAIADTLLEEATRRRAALLDNPNLYLVDKGLPLLAQLRDALHAGDLRKVSALTDTSTGTGFRLQRALQTLAEN